MQTTAGAAHDTIDRFTTRTQPAGNGKSGDICSQIGIWPLGMWQISWDLGTSWDWDLKSEICGLGLGISRGRYQRWNLKSEIWVLGPGIWLVRYQGLDLVTGICSLGLGISRDRYQRWDLKSEI